MSGALALFLVLHAGAADDEYTELAEPTKAASAPAGEAQAPETALRLGYSYGYQPGYFMAYTLDSEGLPQAVPSGVFGGDGVYRVPGAMWLRLEAQARQDSIRENQLFRYIAGEVGTDSALTDAEGSWLDGRASLEAYWESPQVGPVLARVGSRSTANVLGGHDVMAELGVILDTSRNVRTGLGAELGVPLRFGAMEIAPTVCGAYLIPVYAGPKLDEDVFGDEWAAIDLLGAVQEVGARLEVSSGRVSLRLAADASKFRYSAYDQSFFEEIGEPLPERKWGVFTTTALVGVRFGGGKAEATAETKGSGAAAPEAAPKQEIVDTGIASIDDVFRPARNILETVEEARNAVRDLRVSVQQAAGLAEGTTLQETLTSLAAEFAKGVTVSMDGLRPVFKVKPRAPKQVQDVVKAIDTGVPTLLAALEELSTVPARVEKIVAAAQSLPAKLPADAKAAGISPLQVPALLKKLKGNLKAVSAVPGLAASVLQEVKDTLAAIASLAK